MNFARTTLLPILVSGLWIDTFIIEFGTGRFHILLPAIVCLCFAGLVVNTYQIQKKL